jgi:hypothetical protein
MMVSGSDVRQVPRFLLRGFGGFRRTVLEAEAVVSGFEDVTSVGGGDQRPRGLVAKAKCTPKGHLENPSIFQ